MRNVVLVTIDSLRADHCGFMGYDRDTTPTMDAMADAGLVFENAIAPGPSTYESLPAILTGDLMVPHSFSDSESNNTSLNSRYRDIRLNMYHETIAEWFAAQGYSTAAFTSNPYTGANTAISRGFDMYEDFLNRKETNVIQRFTDIPIVSEIENVFAMLNRDRASKPWQSFYERIIKWTEQTEEPYFLWVFLLEPHTPYLVEQEYLSDIRPIQMYYHNWKLWLTKKWKIPPEYLNLDKRILVKLYDNAIKSVDQFLGKLREDLATHNPAIIVHADHGEAFGEHDIYGHRKYLYEENVHVPLFVYNTSHKDRISTPVSLTVIPDLLSGIALDDVCIPSPGYALSRTLMPQRLAVRTSHWKYVSGFESGAKVTEEELYDLRSDPAEIVNISADKDKLTELLRLIAHSRIGHETETIAIRRSISEITSEL